jgi:hypothetical protein
MLEEVQMAPALLHRVVHRTGRLTTSLVRTGEPGPTREVQPDLERAEQLVELHRGHLPRRGQPQRRSEHRKQARIICHVDLPSTVFGLCRNYVTRGQEPGDLSTRSATSLDAGNETRCTDALGVAPQLAPHFVEG